MLRSLSRNLLILCGVVALAMPVEARRRPSPPATVAEWRARTERAEQDAAEEWGVYVEDLRDGRVVFQHQPTRQLIPASNRKLAIIALAFDTLGPPFRFETEFGLIGPEPRGRAHYHGDLVIRSAGDPSLGPLFSKRLDEPERTLRRWATDLHNQGVAYIHGDLIVDATAFGEDQGRLPSAWDESHRGHTYAPLPSALAFCENLLRVGARPASQPDRAGRISISPRASSLRLINRTLTRARVSRRRRGITVAFDEAQDALSVGGRLALGQDEEVARVPMPDPLAVVGDVVRRAVEASGVHIVGETVVRTRVEASPREFARCIGLHTSPPLTEVLLKMSRESNNFLAEQVWRAVAFEVGGRGDPLMARQVEAQWLRRARLRCAAGWDGSGLSRRTRYSALDLAHIAQYIHHSPYREEAMACLARSGARKGTLRRRSFDAAPGRVWAKTGLLSGARALTGFILDAEGAPRYVFSIMVNKPRDRPDSGLITRIDRLIALMIERLDETNDE